MVKGYEFERGQYVTFTQAELKGLDIESSKTIDLETFVPRAEVDPLYFNAGYYIYPDGAIGTDAYRVITAAMVEAGMAGLGRLTLSRRERMVLVEPRGAGLALITLRSADEVRAAQFDDLVGEVDPEAIAIAEMIIKRRAGRFDPSTFRDRYQEALRELIEAKIRGLLALDGLLWHRTPPPHIAEYSAGRISATLRSAIDIPTGSMEVLSRAWLLPGRRSGVRHP